MVFDRVEILHELMQKMNSFAVIKMCNLIYSANEKNKCLFGTT